MVQYVLLGTFCLTALTFFAFGPIHVVPSILRPRSVDDP